MFAGQDGKVDKSIWTADLFGSETRIVKPAGRFLYTSSSSVEYTRYTCIESHPSPPSNPWDTFKFTFQRWQVIAIRKSILISMHLFVPVLFHTKQWRSVRILFQTMIWPSVWRTNQKYWMIPIQYKASSVTMQAIQEWFNKWFTKIYLKKKVNVDLLLLLIFIGQSQTSKTFIGAHKRISSFVHKSVSILPPSRI